MKNILYTLAIVLMSSVAMAQTTTENYVKSTTYQVKTLNGTTLSNSSTPLTDDDKIVSITYFDGLGRPIQSITKQAGGNHQDIISPIVYDVYGRQPIEYLPYVDASQVIGTANLNYRNHAQLLIDLEDYYVNKYPEDVITSSTINAYSEKAFESSPLNRVLKQAAPGKDWEIGNGHEIKFEYQANILNEVKLYRVTLSYANNTYTPTLIPEGSYSAGELYKTITKDENWTAGNNHTTEEFKDSQGRVVLKRTYADINSVSTAHDTYYIYDDYGNLTYVLPPLSEANTSLPTSTMLNELCYQYKYDQRNRLVEKKIPAKGWEYIVYDKLDRPVLTQDTNLKNDKLWLFTKYDALDRVVYTGMYINTMDRTGLQHSIDSHATLNEVRTSGTTLMTDGSSMYYTINAFPNTDKVVLHTINYYDDYNWDTANSFEANYNLSTQTGLNIIDNSITKTTTNGWNAGFKTSGTISGDGYIQWTVPTTDYRVVVGLSKTNSAPDDTRDTIDYGIYTYGIGDRVYVREEGNAPALPAIYFVAGDVFRVERTGNQISYIKNDVVFYVSSISSVGDLIGDSSFYETDASIEDMFIGYSTLGQSFTSNTLGLITGSKVRTLETNDWTNTETYYDEKSRPIYITSGNEYLDTIDALSSKLDFNGKVLKTHTTHLLAANKYPIVTIDKFSYDHTGRLLRQVQQVNNESEELLVKNTYDELGQLEQKQVGGTLSELSTYVNVIGLSAGSTITKATGVNGWDSGLSTQQVISGDGYIRFTTVTGNKSLMAGLSYTDTNVHFNTIKYAIYIKWDGLVHIRESGTDKGNKTTYVPGDTFSVERRGTTIYYLKNGEPFYRSALQTTTATMIGDLSMSPVGASIKDFVLVDLDNELQEVDYTYNIRGWLKGINDVENIGNDLFSFKLNYNTKELGSTNTELFNGNISETIWKTVNDVNAGNETRGYAYSYDALNRISSGEYGIKTTGVFNLSNRYSISGLNYDKNGNISSLFRGGENGDIDDLVYTYNGNQLTKVDDLITTSEANKGFNDGNTVGDDYTYDVNGNMTVDKNKGISLIQYNHLNLPTFIVTSNPVDGGQITYTYDATGVKLSKRVDFYNGNSTTTKYAGNFIYENTGSGDLLKFFSHPEGYVEPILSGSTIKGFNYVYQYKDHLGNIRLAYSDSDENGTINPNTEIIEENNYYPFGLKHKGYNNVINGTDHKYGYNGKEENEEIGLNTLDFGARMYDPTIGRWNGIDALAEVYHTDSPYNYVLNNPLSFIDPDGRQVKGVTKDDAKEVHGELNKAFKGDQFEKLRSLLTRGKNNNKKSFDKIDGDALKDALSGLEGDDLALAEIVTGAINSDDVHTVEFVETSDNLSSAGTDGFNATFEKLYKDNNIPLPVGGFPSRKGKDIEATGGSGQNFPTSGGSHSVILKGSGINHGANGNRTTTTFHEIFGHGIPSARKSSDAVNNANAIRTENLVRRVLGIQAQRDGSGHSGGKIKTPSALPTVKN